MHDKKVLVIENVYYEEECKICVDEISDVKELAEKFVQDISDDVIAIDILLKNDSFVKALDRKGFRNVEKIKNLEEKITASKRFYSYKPSNYGGSFTELNLNNLDCYTIAEENVILLQLVDKCSIAKIDPKAHKRIQEIVKKKEENEKLKAEKAQKRQEKKKLKEIEKAKQLLKEAGVK